MSDESMMAQASAPSSSSSESSAASASSSSASSSASFNTGASLTPASVSSGASTSPDPANAGAAGATPPPYQPNFKYRFRDPASDNKLELEFDDWAKGLIKDPELENKFRDLYTKAYGVDYLKPRFEKTREELNSVRGEYTRMTQTLKDLGGYVQKGDFGNFFNALQIPKEKIFQYVYDELNRANLPPEQQQILTAREEAERRAQLLERQYQELEQRHTEHMTQVRARELDMALGKPDVAQIATSYDQRKGKQGSFRNEVIMRGLMHYQLYGVDISPEQAVSEVLSVVGHEQAQGVAMPQQQAQGQAEAARPTLPNIGGKNTSPMKKMVKSLDDIRRLAAE